MITGIRRRKTAQESADLFQTTKLIASHFRRDSDKKKIWEISGKENTLSNLLIASSAIHAYHYLGIHIMDTLESGNISVQNVETVEKLEKSEIYNEISTLINNSIDYELGLLDFENEILSEILNKVKDIKEEIPDSAIEDFRDELEDQLTEILHKYPNVYLFDYAGDILGYSDLITEEIVEKTSGLRATSRELEEELKAEGREDTFMGLSVLKGVKNRMMKQFEFNSLKDLEMGTVSMNMLIKSILYNLFEKFPTSDRGLDAYFNAIEFSKILVGRFQDSNSTKIDYDLLEFEIVKIIKDKIIEICTKTNSNYLLYFIQGLIDKDFYETYSIFTKYGVNDIPEFARLFNTQSKKFFSILKIYGISKMDIQRLSSINEKNPIKAAELKLLVLKEKYPELKEKTLNDLIIDNVNHKNIIAEIVKSSNLSVEEFIKLCKKNDLIQKKILEPFKFSNFYSVLIFYEHEEILENIAREIYFIFLSKITRQVSRVLECYIRTKEDKSLLLLGLRKIKSAAGGPDEWVAVKIEELIIERLMSRQRELAMIFNAENDPFIVNGFILARMLDLKLNETQKTLKEEPSSIYFDVKDLPLPEDLISPVSYCIAFDLLERFKEYKERKALQAEVIAVKEEAKFQLKKEEIKKAQSENTFNWIDRKITSSIMRITSKGINPTTLYWKKDKDSATCSDNIKLHSESGDSVVDQMTDYYFFALTRMKDLNPKTKVPPIEELKGVVQTIIAGFMESRIGSLPDEALINEKIIEGDRWNAANEISNLIGKKLDKILYKKFKKSLK